MYEERKRSTAASFVKSHSSSFTFTQTTKEPEAEPKASTETTLQKPAPGTKTPYPSKGMSTFVAKKPSVLHNPTLAAQTPKPATKPSFFKSAPNGSTKNVVTPGTTAVKANRHKVTFRLPNKEDPKAAVPEPALQPMETEGMDIDKPDPPAPTLTTESIIDGMNDMAVDKKNADTDETFVDSASATTESFESEFIQAEEEEEEDDASQPYVMVDHDDFDLIHEEFLLLARDCKDRSKAFESALLDMQVDLTLANTSTLMARTEGQELARRLEDAAAQMAESMDQATELLASIMHM